MRWQSFVRFAAAWFTLALAAGCGGNRSFDSYVPAEQTARDALTAALNAWKNGKSPGRIDGASPAVQVVDSQWQQGRRLADYVVGEKHPGEGPPRFAVRLTLDGPRAEEDTQFVVLGREPYWVYREKDFVRISGWEHHAPKPE